KRMEFQATYPPERIDSSHSRPPKSRNDFYREVDRLVLDRYSPAGVVITSDMEVVQVRGSTGKYLQPAPGEVSMNLLKMAREGLLLELRTAIHLARKRRRPVRKDGVRVKQNGHTGNVGIEVVPISRDSGETYFLVLFHDGGPVMAVSEPPPRRAK